MDFTQSQSPASSYHSTTQHSNDQTQRLGSETTTGSRTASSQPSPASTAQTKRSLLQTQSQAQYGSIAKAKAQAQASSKGQQVERNPAQLQNESIDGPQGDANTQEIAQRTPVKKPRRNRRKGSTVDDADDANKRRCVSTACIACRKRKSKCDGNLPACAACSQVYGTDCIYDPNSDHRRKGVYKKDIDALKTSDSTLQTLIHAILNYPEEEVPALVRQIRACESLDDVAASIVARENGTHQDDEIDDFDDTSPTISATTAGAPTFENQLGTKMGELRLDDGSVRYIGGTSHLLFLNADDVAAGMDNLDQYQQQDNPIISWSTVTSDPELVVHLLNMYFTWHYTFFTCIPKAYFYRDFLLGQPPKGTKRKTEYCTPLLVNAILALGCHFTSMPGARDDPEDSATAGDHFFREAKRLIMENDEHEKPKITTIQALALMSVREAGCGREARGWVYSGMSFRMACDMGLHLDSGALAAGSDRALDEGEEDGRRVTFWGCFLFDKCWSNYLGRLPQLPQSQLTCPKYDVFPDEDSASWTPCTDSGLSSAHVQPSRTRAVALQITSLCEISGDLMRFFYNPSEISEASRSKGKQAELKKLSEIHSRLETWRRNLPNEMEPKEGALSSVLIMHMFFQLLFIHLFRPFLKYNAATTPLPSTVSPQKLCTHAASMISKLLRLYKRSHGLRQIPNVCVYIAHTACTIHLLNLPNKEARRDIIHGVKHLEEIAEGWLCARRTLGILSTLARQWNVELPDEAAAVLARTDAKFGRYRTESTSPQMRSTVPRPNDENVKRGTPDAPVSFFAQSVSTKQHAQQQAQISQQQMNPPAIQPRPANVSHARVRKNTQTSSPNQPGPPHSIDLMTTRSTSEDFSPNPSHIEISSHGQFSIQSFSPQVSTYPPYPQAQPSYPTTSNPRADNLPKTTLATSPSTMFGGVEQLLREGSDWIFQDQAQLGDGFSSSSSNASQSHQQSQDQGQNMSVTSAQMQQSSSGAQTGAGGTFNDWRSAPMQDLSVDAMDMSYDFSNLDAVTNGLGQFTGYDEEEWYR